MATALLLSSLDTRSQETLYAKQLIEQAGCKVVLMDISMGRYMECDADYSCVDVAREAGVSFEAISGMKGTGDNMNLMVRGAISIAKRLADEGAVDGIAGLGGASATSALSLIMRTLPFGF